MLRQPWAEERNSCSAHSGTLIRAGTEREWGFLSYILICFFEWLCPFVWAYAFIRWRSVVMRVWCRVLKGHRRSSREERPDSDTITLYAFTTVSTAWTASGPITSHFKPPKAQPVDYGALTESWINSRVLEWEARRLTKGPGTSSSAFCSVSCSAACAQLLKMSGHGRVRHIHDTN